MKTVQEKSEFKPVTIILETQEELSNFIRLVKSAYWEFDDSREDTAFALFESLRGAGVEVGTL